MLCVLAVLAFKCALTLQPRILDRLELMGLSPPLPAPACASAAEAPAATRKSTPGESATSAAADERAPEGPASRTGAPCLHPSSAE